MFVMWVNPQSAPATGCGYLSADGSVVRWAKDAVVFDSIEDVNAKALENGWVVDVGVRTGRTTAYAVWTSRRK